MHRRQEIITYISILILFHNNISILQIHLISYHAVHKNYFIAAVLQLNPNNVTKINYTIADDIYYKMVRF